jgi:hypothetical protein
MAGRDIQVTKLGRTIGTTGYSGSASYMAVFTEGDKQVMVEARVRTSDLLEQTDEPEQAIQKWLAARATPKHNTVVNVDLSSGRLNARNSGSR